MQSHQPLRHSVYIVSSIAALAGLLFGFDTGIISGALLFLEKSFDISTEMKGLIVGSVLLGAMPGSLVSGRLTDKLGRKKVMFMISVLFISGTLIAALANQLSQIFIGRILIGLAVGIGSYTAPLYIAEISAPEVRGKLVTFNQLAITIGILCSFIINYVFINIDGTWRWMFAIGLIPAVMLFFGLFFLPESPRWLLKQNQDVKATGILQSLRKSSNVSREINEIKSSLSIKQSRFLDIFSPMILPVLSLGLMMGFIQQMTGINTIIYYAPTIFKLAGFQSTATSILATIGIGVINVLATFIAIKYLDKLGRRPLLLAGLSGMCLSLTGLGLAFAAGDTSGPLCWIALICTFSYVICFAFSLGAILWLIVSEIFPLEVRGAAMSVAVFSCWFWNFIVSATFLSLLNYLGTSHTFYIYSFMCFLSIIFCYYKVPETSGVTLEQIEMNIRNAKPLRYIGQASS